MSKKVAATEDLHEIGRWKTGLMLVATDDILGALACRLPLQWTEIEHLSEPRTSWGGCDEKPQMHLVSRCRNVVDFTTEQELSKC